MHSAPLVKNSTTKNIRGPVSVVGNIKNPCSIAKPPAIVKVTSESTRTPQRPDSSVHSAPLVKNSTTKNIRGPVSVVGNIKNPCSIAKPPAIVKVTSESDTDNLSKVSSVNSFSEGVDKIIRPSPLNEPQLNTLTEDSDEGRIVSW